MAREYVDANYNKIDFDALRDAPVGFTLFEDGRSKWLARRGIPSTSGLDWQINSEDTDPKSYEDMVAWVTSGQYAPKPTGPKTYPYSESLEDALEGATLLSATGVVWIVVGGDEVNSAEYGRTPFDALAATEFPMVDIGDKLRALIPKPPAPPAPTADELLDNLDRLVTEGTEASRLPWSHDGFRSVVDAADLYVARDLPKGEALLIAGAVNVLPKMTGFARFVLDRHVKVGKLCSQCEMEPWPCDEVKALEEALRG